MEWGLPVKLEEEGVMAWREPQYYGCALSYTLESSKSACKHGADWHRMDLRIEYT